MKFISLICHFLAIQCLVAPTTFIQETSNQTNPMQIYRSSILSLTTLSNFPCTLSYTLTSTWLSPQIATLSSNPTSSTAQLVIPANTLSFGTYEFTYQVNALVSSSNTLLSSNVPSVFVEIIPTGLAVFALANGVSGVMIGYQQAYTLSPGLYSIDFDYLISPNNLNFKFYCSTVMLNMPSSTKNNFDLMAFKMNSSLATSANNTCFSSTSNFLMNFCF